MQHNCFHVSSLATLTIDKIARQHPIISHSLCLFQPILPLSDTRILRLDATEAYAEDPHITMPVLTSFRDTSSDSAARPVWFSNDG